MVTHPSTVGHLSVLTPIRDGSEFAHRYVSMILGLSPPPYEVILVDDHSGDGSPEFILSMLRSNGFTRVAVHTAVGEGLANARNEGLRCIRTAYTAFLDVDDFWPAGRLGGFLPHLNKAGAQLLHGGFLLTRDGEQVRGNVARLASGPRGYRQLLRGTHCIGGSASGAIVHTESALSIGGFKEYLTYGEDFEFWLRYVMHFGVTLVESAPVEIERSGGIQALDDFARCKDDFIWKTKILEEHLTSEYGEAAPFWVHENVWCHRWRLFLTLASARIRGFSLRTRKETGLPAFRVRSQVRLKRFALVLSLMDAVLSLTREKIRMPGT